MLRTRLMCLLLALFFFPSAAEVRTELSAAVSFPVHIQIDITTRPLGAVGTVWRFFGADEPNYAYMKNGKKLIAELGCSQYHLAVEGGCGA